MLEILAALGYLRLCSHPLERLVMIVAGDDRGKLASDLPPTQLHAFDVHNLSLQVLSVSSAPVPFLASTFVVATILHPDSPTSCDDLVSMDCIYQVLLKAAVFLKTDLESCISCFFENSFRTFGTRST